MVQLFYNYILLHLMLFPTINVLHSTAVLTEKSGQFLDIVLYKYFVGYFDNNFEIVLVALLLLALLLRECSAIGT